MREREKVNPNLSGFPKPDRLVNQNKNMKWISVKEKTPEDGKPCFAYDGKMMFIGAYCYIENEGWFWAKVYTAPWENKDGWDCEAEIDEEYNVTHWLPFPNGTITDLS